MTNSVCHCTFRRERNSPRESGYAITNKFGDMSNVLIIIPDDVTAKTKIVLHNVWDYHLDWTHSIDGTHLDKTS
jgi:hypothetical protein